MKWLFIPISCAWLGCLVEMVALAAAACRGEDAGCLSGVMMLTGWLSLIGFCGWKSTARPPADSPHP